VNGVAPKFAVRTAAGSDGSADNHGYQVPVNQFIVYTKTLFLYILSVPASISNAHHIISVVV